ncbi:MAG: glutamate--tRNA ligase family protein [Myxococcota bacterium]|nr:glutamate--tRNA ligase family protein [Myxococcota bacterium]
MSVVGRLAPTPSGHLHLGNALAFGAAWLSVRNQGGQLLLRVEDLDRGRARSDIADAQRDDLRWLGLHWDVEVQPQSMRTYGIEGLETYLCDCTRKQRAVRPCPHRAAPAEAGAVRFRSARRPVAFVDRAQGPQMHTPSQDPLLLRRSGAPGYPLAVVVEDHRDGVTEVVRGGDLLAPTATQVELYEALGWTPPTWLHVPLLLGPDGRKLSKSHGSTELRSLRAAGWTAGDVWTRLLPLLGIPTGVHLERAELIPERVPEGPFVVDGRGVPRAP